MTDSGVWDERVDGALLQRIHIESFEKRTHLIEVLYNLSPTSPEPFITSDEFIRTRFERAHLLVVCILESSQILDFGHRAGEKQMLVKSHTLWRIKWWYSR